MFCQQKIRFNFISKTLKFNISMNLNLYHFAKVLTKTEFGFIK